MTLLYMQYTFIFSLICSLLPSVLAAEEDPSTPPPDPAPAPCSTVSSALNISDCPWEKFSERLSGASIDFPPGLFERVPAPPGSTHEVLVSDQGEMIVSLWSAPGNTQLSSSEAMATDLYNSGLASVTHQKANEGSYTFAGTLGSRSLLKRRVFSEATPGASTTVCVTWSSEAAGDWAQLASTISLSLEPGGNQSNSTTLPNRRPGDRIATCLGL